MKIVKHPETSLKEISKEIKNIDQNLLDTIKKMKETMLENNGIGLAAVQVGIQKRFFLAKDDEKILTFINPKITGYTEKKDFHEEGCLSVPKVYAQILRPIELELEYTDETGKQFKKVFNKLLARIIQHEIDHLVGILFFEHLNNIKRKLLLKEYNSLKEKVS